MKIEPNYFAIIPANVRYDKRLKPNEKLLFGEIYALSQKNGYCYATNRYFAELYNVENETISRWINRLKKFGYIESNITQNEDKSIDKRVIIPIVKKINTVLTETSTPSCENNQPPIDEKVKENNTRKNNTRENIYNAEIEEIINYMNQDVLKESNIYGTITFSYKTTTPKTRSLIIARLKEGYTVDDFKDVIFLKYQDWVMDEKNSKQMRKYYRPETLFGNKFENYLQEYKTLE